MYKPAKNFTTQSAQPLPAQLPSLLIPINSHSTTQSSAAGPSGPSYVPQYHIALPPWPPRTCNGILKDYLLAENENLCKTIDAVGRLLEANFAQMKLMEAENGRLQNKVFAKKSKKKVAVNTGTSHHLTGEENMWELFKGEMRTVLADLKPKFTKSRDGKAK